ncbi:MAG TPA: hypothetical protein PKA66_02630 [Gemmatimonadales bacterium]|nr:hypothetical protein [Gemmatimonadales bacterium]
MCRRWGWAAALALLWANPLAAQGQAEALRRVEAQLDSMRGVAELRASALAAASATDTAVAGRLRVTTSVPLRPLAQAAADQAWALLVRRFGASVTSRATIPVIQFGDATSSPLAGADTSEVARGFERLASDAIWRHQGALFAEWLRGNVPGVEFPASDRAVIAEELLRTPARSNRACYQGDAAACAVSLGLRVGPDTLAEWYLPEAWPRLATMVGGQLSGLETVSKQQCEQAGDSAACRAILTPAHVLLPVSVGGRRFLLQEALDVGGDGAFERLTSAGDLALADRLSNAAGLPLDSLLTRWSTAIRAGAPHGPAQPSWELFLAAAWSALLLLVVLGGPRWR